VGNGSTSRGPTPFRLNSEDDVHRLDGRRAMIKDAHGIRYLISDTHALDAASRRLLELYLWCRPPVIRLNGTGHPHGRRFPRLTLPARDVNPGKHAARLALLHFSHKLMNTNGFR
jgi:hypothetical protein